MIIMVMIIMDKKKGKNFDIINSLHIKTTDY